MITSAETLSDLLRLVLDDEQPEDSSHLLELFAYLSYIGEQLDSAEKEKEIAIEPLRKKHNSLETALGKIEGILSSELTPEQSEEKIKLEQEKSEVVKLIDTATKDKESFVENEKALIAATINNVLSCYTNQAKKDKLANILFTCGSAIRSLNDSIAPTVSGNINTELQNKLDRVKNLQRIIDITWQSRPIQEVRQMELISSKHSLMLALGSYNYQALPNFLESTIGIITSIIDQLKTPNCAVDENLVHLFLQLGDNLQEMLQKIPNATAASTNKLIKTIKDSGLFAQIENALNNDDIPVKSWEVIKCLNETENEIVATKPKNNESQSLDLEGIDKLSLAMTIFTKCAKKKMDEVEKEKESNIRVKINHSLEYSLESDRRLQEFNLSM